ncbi:MAG: hypothetical protein JRJ87_01080, partial [Deltaproteobacteria bacterium]|nr:hypothetical protein [Deltaproteobacteria bacterium]
MTTSYDTALDQQDPARQVGPRRPIGPRIDHWLDRVLGGKTVSLLVIAALVGVAGGYGAILFRYLIEWVNQISF